MLERVNGLFPTRVAIINPEDIFTRLPGDSKSFEEQRAVPTPAFEPYFASSQGYQSHAVAAVGVMGHLVRLVSIWGDVMATIYRLSHRAPADFGSFDFFKFHRSVLSRLDDWKASLPPPLDFSPANLGAIGREDRGTLILMHTVYHLTIVKLHRHVHSHLLTTNLRYQYASIAQDHAQRLLDVVCAVARDSNTGRVSTPPPFISFAILETIDVLSAEGTVDDLPHLVDGLALARSVLELLGTVWVEATVHQVAMDHRLDRLATLRDRNPSHDLDASGQTTHPQVQGIRLFEYHHEGQADKKLRPGRCWQMANPLEVRFPREMDCVYSTLVDVGYAA
jgi:hypothetical protein